MQNFWIALTTLSILSQIPHAYWSINQFSQIEQAWLKTSQNVAFCLIISVAILGFVLEGRHDLALGGAIVEMIINYYYYDNQFRQGKWYKRILNRENWVAYFLAVLIPISIFIFSSMIQLN